MARIRGRDTTPEIEFQEALRKAPGIVVQIQTPTPFGRVDFIVQGVLPVAVFVDGCFWHGCPDHYTRPSSREEFWARKLAATVERDRRQTVALMDAGWCVVRRWEHEVRQGPAQVASEVLKLAGGAPPSDVTQWRVVRVDVLDPVQRLERRVLQDLLNPAMTREEVGLRKTTKPRAMTRRRMVIPERHG